MSYIEPDLEPDAMDLDLQEDTAHTGSVPQVFHDRVNTFASLCTDDHLIIIISSIALCVAMVAV